MSFVRRKRGQVLLVHNERDRSSARVRQRELHRFASPAELEEVLAPAAWTRWTRALAWRERGLEFDWPEIRERLGEELKAWNEAPSGAKHRRNQKIERLAAELVVELAPLSVAKASDAAVVARVRPSLLALRESIDRLLPSDLKPPNKPPAQENPVVQPTPATHRAADEVFEKGMDHWWNGDRRGAVKLFRHALELDSRHADAHNHLGILSLEARKLKAAEQHFRAAIDGGERHLEREGGEVQWGFLENRPYLRGLANLALVLAEQKKWAEALAIHRQMLKLNPGDNQGVRYLIGFECLRVGDNEGAIKAFESCLHEEVGCAFGLALAKLRALPSADIGEALLTGFAANRYVAPMLLGETWERLDAFHGSNMAEPEWAHDVVVAQADLWHAIPRGAERLRFWWTAPPVATWRRKLDDVMVRLKDLSMSSERSALVSQWSDLRSEGTVRELARLVRTAS